jgi:hypothetical protein
LTFSTLERAPSHELPAGIIRPGDAWGHRGPSRSVREGESLSASDEQQSWPQPEGARSRERQSAPLETAQQISGHNVTYFCASPEWQRCPMRATRRLEKVEIEAEANRTGIASQYELSIGSLEPVFPLIEQVAHVDEGLPAPGCSDEFREGNRLPDK